MLTDGPSDAWILAEVEVDIPAWNEEHRENVNEIECSESLCVGLNLRGSEKATPEAAVRGSRAVSNAVSFSLHSVDLPAYCYDTDAQDLA